MAADKEFKVKISGDSSELGAEAKKATSALQGIKDSAKQLGVEIGKSLIDGVKGFGLFLSAEIAKAIAENKQIISNANVAGVSPDFIRGGKAAFGRKGVEEAFLPTLNAIGQAQAEALAGEDRAQGAFQRFGVDFTKPLERVFIDLATNLRNLEPQVADADPLRVLLGGNAQQAMFAFNNRVGLRLEDDAKTPVPEWVSKLAFLGYRMFAPMDALMEYMIGPSFEGPKGKFLPNVTSSAEAAEKIQENTKQALLGVLRDELTTEERIVQARKTQAELLERAANEVDPLKAARIEADAAALEKEIQGLYRELPGKPEAAGPAQRAYEPDQLARVGIFVGGAGQTITLLNQQVAKLDQAVTELRGMRADNERNFG